MKNWNKFTGARFFNSWLIIFLSFIIFHSCSNHAIKKAHVISKPQAMVAAAHPLAATVGLDILNQGGNAVDAALAVAFALSMAEPNASGIGGGGLLMMKMNNQEPIMVDYREMAPGQATAAYYYQTDSSFAQFTNFGAKAIGVPGLVACAELVLPKYGTMSLKQILLPAIEIATNGVIISENLNRMIVDELEKIISFPPTAEIYLSDMLPLEIGSLLKNIALAGTLQKIADSGGRIFYSGEIAQAIAAEVQQRGGILSASDLFQYRAKERQPIIGTYRGFQIISSAPPSGGLYLIELLNIMEGYDVHKLGHNSLQFIHLFTEAMKVIYADKIMNQADPDFYNVPIAHFKNKKYAKEIRKDINPEHAQFNYAAKTATIRESNDTSHLSIVDHQGNVISLTQSINNWFGSGLVVKGTGILLNDHLSDFASEPGFPNSIEPFKRPASSTAPTLILKDGKPFMTVGTPGGTRIISALAQIIMNVIDFNMTMDEAIEAPRVFCFKDLLHIEGRIGEEIISALNKKGHQIKVHPDFDNYFGGAQGIIINQDKGLDGGADSRRDGVALSY